MKGLRFSNEGEKLKNSSVYGIFIVVLAEVVGISSSSNCYDCSWATILTYLSVNDVCGCVLS